MTGGSTAGDDGSKPVVEAPGTGTGLAAVSDHGTEATGTPAAAPAPDLPPAAPAPDLPAAAPAPAAAWPLWEVFVRSSRGLSHVHAGSLHAPDADMAVRNARDLYTRRNEGVSLWVVPASAIIASDPDAKGQFFESPQGKDYRHATYYTKSEGVKHL